MEKRSLDAVVLSDLHLGTYGCHGNEILSYLRSISPQILILNGDIIDIWQLSKHYFPPGHVAVIKEIMEMMSRGTRIVYITGNHDEVLRRYSDLQMGNFRLTDKLVMEIDNKMTWIFHGDVFDNTAKGAARFWARLGSHGYAVLLMTNRLINRFMKTIGRERISIAKRIMSGINKSIIRIDDFETTVAEIAIHKKYDFVICGHIHQPRKRKITTAGGTVMYLNSGDWVEHLTALEYYNHDWHIYQHQEGKTQKETIKTIIPETEVITDDISYHLYPLNALKKTI